MWVIAAVYDSCGFYYQSACAQICTSVKGERRDLLQGEEADCHRKMYKKQAWIVNSGLFFYAFLCINIAYQFEILK